MHARRDKRDWACAARNLTEVQSKHRQGEASALEISGFIADLPRAAALFAPVPLQPGEAMKRRVRQCGVVAALILGLLIPLVPPATAGDAESSNPAASASDAEFDGECVMGLALGKDIKTDCSVSTVYSGKKLCFGNETARTLFLKKPDEFLLQAHVYYSSKQPSQSGSNIEPKPAE
jgi:hypothetical protein